MCYDLLGRVWLVCHLVPQTEGNTPLSAGLLLPYSKQAVFIYLTSQIGRLMWTIAEQLGGFTDDARTRIVKTPRRFQSNWEVFSMKSWEKTSPPALSTAAVAALVRTCSGGRLPASDHLLRPHRGVCVRCLAWSTHATSPATSPAASCTLPTTRRRCRSRGRRLPRRHRHRCCLLLRRQCRQGPQLWQRARGCEGVGTVIGGPASDLRNACLTVRSHICGGMQLPGLPTEAAKFALRACHVPVCGVRA